MPYEIEDKDGRFEVKLSGDVSAATVIAAVRDLRTRDPRKAACDLWLVDDAGMIPLAAFPSIAGTVLSYCPPDLVGNKTAVVAANPMQRAAMEMYREEATELPFPIRVFERREDAEAWLKT